MHITKRAKNLIKIQSKIKLKSEAKYATNRKQQKSEQNLNSYEMKHVKKMSRENVRERERERPGEKLRRAWKNPQMEGKTLHFNFLGIVAILLQVVYNYPLPLHIHCVYSLISTTVKEMCNFSLSVQDIIFIMRENNAPESQI